MLKKHAKGYKRSGPTDVAWWILEKCPIPDGMLFVKDPKQKNHYFLAVTERMHVDALVKKLRFISFRMNLARDISFD